MISRIAALAVMLSTPLAAAAPGPAPDLPVLSLEQETALRCSALFGIVAFDQARGAPVDPRWPAMAVRGKEFFVRTGARLMDETGIDRAQLQALVQREVVGLQAGGGAAAAPGALAGSLREPCLMLLDAALPVDAGRK